MSYESTLEQIGVRVELGPSSRSPIPGAGVENHAVSKNGIQGLGVNRQCSIE